MINILGTLWDNGRRVGLRLNYNGTVRDVSDKNMIKLIENLENKSDEFGNTEQIDRYEVKITKDRERAKLKAIWLNDEDCNEFLNSEGLLKRKSK